MSINSIFKHPYTRELEKTAKLVQPSEQLCQEILGSVLLVAGVTATVSLADAVTSGAALAKAAMLKTVSATVATTVGVTAAAVAGPAVLLPPSIQDAYIADTGSMTQAEIQIDMATSVGLRSVRVISEQGEEQMAAKGEDGVYTVVVNANGAYRIEAVGAGNRMAVASVVVSTIDDSIPVLERYTADSHGVALYFSDRGSGVDWDALTASDAAGNAVQPLSIDREGGSAVFATPAADLQVYVQDLAGNQAVCAIQVSGSATQE